MEAFENIENGNLPIMVSIFVLTYNQEKYIAQTLDSILDQQVDFHFKIVIGDDASTDRTSEICANFAFKFPNHIDYARNEVNLGLMRNFVKTAKRLQGKYIAICDGDDYWIDPLKLQTQVDYLEKHSNVAVVGSQVNIIRQDDEPENPVTRTNIAEYDFECMVQGNKIPAPSAMFRTIEQINDLPEWFNNLPYGDWPLYLMSMSQNNGKAVLFPTVTAAYRKEIGASHSMRKDLATVFSKNASILEKLQQENFNKAEKQLLIKGQIHQLRKKVAVDNANRNYRESFATLMKIQGLKPSLQSFKFYLYSLVKRSKTS